jgi:integrase
MWVPAEGQHIKKSLKTKDLDFARARAEQEVLDILQDIRSGKQVFGITLGQLVENYLAYRAKDVALNEKTKGQEGITAERLGTIRSQLNALLRLKSRTTKLSEFDAESLYEYRQMRFEQNPDISLVSIRNEIATIGAMFKFAYPKYTNIPKLKFRPIKITSQMKKDMRRDTFSLDEMRRITRYFRTWVSKKECPDPVERVNRMFVRDFFLILTNTCMRTGELKQLRWSDVKKLEPAKNERGLDVQLITLVIRPETTKTRNERMIVSRGGEYFKRVRTYSKFLEQDDFIFPNSKGTNPMDERIIYSLWDDLMIKTGFPNHKKRKLSLYSLRHYAITDRLRDLSIWEVSKLSGTGVQYIEDHYGHFLEEDAKIAALKYSRRESVSVPDGVQWD